MFSYSTRLLKPFRALLAQSNGSLPVDQYFSDDADQRVPVQRAHEWLALAVQHTRSPDLGVRAGMLMVAGDAGVIDYVVDSAATVAEGFDDACRYIRLLNDALVCRLEVDGSRAMFCFDTRVVVPPAAEDFMLTGFFTSHAWLRDTPGLEVWFSHGEPTQLLEYRRAFGSTPCRFGAPCTGISFARGHLQQRLPRADPSLHALTRRLADIMLADLPPEKVRVSERVMTLVARELSTPRLGTAWVARRLGMSARTLARRLEAEETTFFALLDEARRLRAVRLMEDGGLTLSEIAFALGFAHVASFHRAFRRWTGTSPDGFRQQMHTRSVMSQRIG